MKDPVPIIHEVGWTGLGGCGKYRLHRDSFPVQAVQPVASSYTVFVIPGPSLNLWAMKISGTKIETVIRTEPSVCYILFVVATLSAPQTRNDSMVISLGQHTWM
jgi:hypothetical protein